MRVAVIGGSNAGVVAAIGAKMKNPDHEIVLFDDKEAIDFFELSSVVKNDKLISSNINVRHIDLTYYIQDIGISLYNNHYVVDVQLDIKKVTYRNDRGVISIQYFDRIILATGTTSIQPAGSVELLSYRNIGEAMYHLDSFVRESRVVVLGGDLMGVNLASLLSDKGHHVTLIERHHDILHLVDSNISKQIKKELLAKGVTLVLNEMIDDIFSTESIKYNIETKHANYHADYAITGLNRIANSELFEDQLETTSAGIILTDSNQETSIKDVYAIGAIAATDTHPKLQVECVYQSNKVDAVEQGKLVAYHL